MIRKIVSYIIIVIAIGIILYLTLMKLDDSVILSELVRSFMNNICSKLGFNTSSEWWNSASNIRLIGHVIEYFVLGLAVGIAIKRKIVAVIVCMSVSLLDQSLKIFIPARHFDKSDIPFDVIGFCCGLFIIWVVKFSARMIKEIGNERRE